MSAYCRSVLLLGLLTAFLEGALPLRNDRLLPYVRFVIGLVSVLVLVRPATDILRAPERITDGIRSFFTTTDKADERAAENAVLRAAASRIADGIIDCLAEEYDIPREKVRISVSLDAEDPEKVRITGAEVKIDAGELPMLLETALLSARLTELVGAPVTIS